ncbi:MAG TPA: mammalian cell entry protein [Pseudonocardiaceae bacterium]|jgi:phospholipid/cholesterol/gamma-HCH transport system substrate-binding protein|nr:mammalian cell entry protein [Pseudonocardiaceae bacterium]
MKRFFMKIFGGDYVHGHQTLSAWKLGAGFLVAVAVIGWAVFNKTQLQTWFTPGENLKVHFASDYRLRPYFSKAKISFVPVGIVTGVDQQEDNSVVVTVKIFGDDISQLGTEPNAVIRPTTLLGGNYFIDLAPGGAKGRPVGEIPVQRAHLPVELDKVLRALQPNALAGLQGTVSKLDQTLQGGTNDALHRLAADAPGSLKPTGQVVDALRGTNPDTDLTDFVSGIEQASQELATPKGRLDSIINDLATTSAVFGRRSADFSSTLDELPATLRSADRGLNRLNTTLDVLDDTVDDIRPTARQLDDTLGHVDPVLRRARPVVRDLRDLLQDARPLVKRLVPNVQDLNDVLDDLRGPVLQRVNGPVSDLLLHSFHGTGPYAQTETDRPVYQEVVYGFATLDRANTQNKNGSGIAFQPLPQPEPAEGVIQNDGQPRVETLERSATDPLRLSPPVQAPPEAPNAAPHNPLLPMLGNAGPSRNEGGR